MTHMVRICFEMTHFESGEKVLTVSLRSTEGGLFKIATSLPLLAMTVKMRTFLPFLPLPLFMRAHLPILFSGIGEGLYVRGEDYADLHLGRN